MWNFLKRVRRYLIRRYRERAVLHHAVEVTAGAGRTTFVAALRQRCEADAVPFTMGGRIEERRLRFHFREQDGEQVCAVIAAAASAIDAVVEYTLDGTRRRHLGQLAEEWTKRGFRAFDLLITERLIDANRDRYHVYTVVEVDLWHLDVNAFKGAHYATAPRFNDVTTSMRWETLDELTGANGAGGRVDDLAAWEGFPDLFGRDFPIDVVYTWVDGTDPEWLAVKHDHRPQLLPSDSGILHAESRNDLKERFNNRDELKYSLRSLEMFAPFIRNIFIVTMNQVPDWLDTDHPQITMVDHRDIYSIPDALPTFNSSSIETQLHHIDGLAEHFIYFNDDVFLGKACDWTEFFYGNGAAKFFPADHSVAAADVVDSAEEYLIADRNAINLFRKEYGFTAHRPMSHVPHAARRSVLYELEEKFQHEFDVCQRARFRSVNDIRPIAFMGHHYGYFTGRAVPGTISRRYLSLWKPAIAAQFDGVLRSRGYHTFCVNDVGVKPEREAEIDVLVHRFLRRYFPYASSFERRGHAGR